MSTKESLKDTRKRNFATVVYPESAPGNWISILDELHVPAFISPLHDKDILPGKEIKKAHYHVIVMFDGKKTLEQFDEIRSAIGGVGHEVVKSLRSYARYLCHLDSPDKVKYNINDVISLGGSDFNSVIESSSDKVVSLMDIIDFCDEYYIVSFRDLIRYCRSCNFEWFRILSESSTLFIREYLKSSSWSYQKLLEVSEFDLVLRNKNTIDELIEKNN